MSTIDLWLIGMYIIEVSDCHQSFWWFYDQKREDKSLAIKASHDETGVVVKEAVRTKKPPLYNVLLLNDDYTPMDFVVSILERYFHKNHAAATEIMLQVHKEGRAICGQFTYEIAETKVTLVIEESRQNDHPLQCVMEMA